MTQATDTRDLTAFADKKVTITYKTDAESEPVTKDGTVQAASAIGVIFKEKGKADIAIIETDSIVSIEEQAEPEPKVLVKKLKPVEKNYRQHLADRHGYLPADLNAMTEAQGKEIHEGIDHGPLAHVHESPKAQQDAQAGQATGEEPIADVSDVEGAEPEPEGDDED